MKPRAICPTCGEECGVRVEGGGEVLARHSRQMTYARGTCEHSGKPAGDGVSRWIADQRRKAEERVAQAPIARAKARAEYDRAIKNSCLTERDAKATLAALDRLAAKRGGAT